MEESELFTVDVYQFIKKADRGENNSHENSNDEDAAADNTSMKRLEEFQNMKSARIIKGRILELEHSNLAGPGVKFKTVVNYEKTLEPASYLGISFQSQHGYISKSDD